MRRRAILSWSSGKDSAFALHLARAEGEVEIVGLLTSVSEEHDRVAIHGVRRSILRAQAEAVGLPLVEVPLPPCCPNEVYEARMGAALGALVEDGVRDVVFGDIHLADVRAYREAQLGRAGMRGNFPLWGRETGVLAQDMLRAGVVAHIAALDPRRVPARLAGVRLDPGLFAQLPQGADPCGENGEFHTLVADAPGFARPLRLVRGKVVERDGFVYADFSLADADG